VRASLRARASSFGASLTRSRARRGAARSVIAAVPTLEKLDNTEVTPEERAAAAGAADDDGVTFEGAGAAADDRPRTP
jgi:hypothetical protein